MVIGHVCHSVEAADGMIPGHVVVEARRAEARFVAVRPVAMAHGRTRLQDSQ
jgi:hypothetical protein